MKIFIASCALCLVLVVGCKKEPVATPSTPGFVDPVNDLVAVTDPIERILYVLDGQKDAVLKFLGAESIGDNTYTISASNMHRQRIPFTFSVQHAATDVLLMHEMNHMQISKRLLDFHDHSAGYAPNHGDFLGALDTNGVCYRIYKNAECKSVIPAWETICFPETNYITNPDTSLTGVRTGKSQIIKHYPISHCYKGNNYCVEALCVAMEVRIYDQNDCGGAPLSTTVASYQYNCAD